MTNISLTSDVLKKLFQNVFFISGTAYAGKSTMIRMLSEKYGGVWCRENYIDKLLDLLNPLQQPNLCYFQTMSDWQEFVNRTPDEYDAWIRGCAKEGVELEIIELIRRCEGDRKVFVDTNIPLDVLREISDYNHVAVMLCDPAVSAARFFERPDVEKQFLYQCIMEAPNPELTMKNFRACLEKINSPEHYAEFENSGFFVLKRDDSRTLEETMEILEKHFKLLPDNRNSDNS